MTAPRFEILGPVRAFRGDDEVDLGPIRQRAVLALLLLRPGEPVPVERIVATLWNGDPPENGVDIVQRYVGALRRALDPERTSLIALTGGGYVLRVADEAVDSGVFRAALSRARAEHQTGNVQAATEEIRRALTLWRDEPLAGLTGPVFEAARARLRSEQSAAAGLGGGQSAAAGLRGGQSAAARLGSGQATAAVPKGARAAAVRATAVVPGGVQAAPVEPMGVHAAAVEPMGAHATAVEPNGVQAAPVAPMGAHATAVEPNGVQAAPVEPKGVHATAVEPKGAHATAVEPDRGHGPRAEGRDQRAAEVEYAEAVDPWDGHDLFPPDPLSII
ncbi:winged helix-turn-helix domain-containing protein [Paractinoplanes deccanensis]|uniref:winged helix-turn-helix domain-containing protein n=1 Tax=Paractinoplanes deccanensis TaxID=113561 RepID=UPI0019427303|nr:winged helix-turn-helix domain-containing protein [Actinoplanes deccanensis]